MELDHLVVGAEHLDDAVAYIEESLGIEMFEGGQHLRFGTHNAVALIGDGIYIEAIARDYDQKNPQGARWFDLDRFQGAPRIITWAVRVPNITRVLAALPESAGQCVELTRGMFDWRINVASSGRMYQDGAFPHVIEWRCDAHPTDHLPMSGAQLARLTIMHPNAAAIAMKVPQLVADPRLDIVSGPQLAFRADFDTALGTKTLLG